MKWKDRGCSFHLPSAEASCLRPRSGLELDWEFRTPPPHPSPLLRSASVSKPCRQAIHQAEGSPEPLNKTFSLPSAESMETNAADVKGVAGITNDVLMAAQAISVPLRPESPALFGACAHVIKGPRAIHRSLTKGKLEPGLHPPGLRSRTGGPGAFYHGHNEDGMKDNAFSLPLPHPFSRCELSSCSTICWKLFARNKQSLGEGYTFDSLLLF